MSNRAAIRPRWTLADRLRKARDAAGLEQRELADALGISRNSVVNYEKGHTQPNKAVLQLWAMRCGVEYDWLKDGDSPFAEPAAEPVRPRDPKDSQPAGYLLHTHSNQIAA